MKKIVYGLTIGILSLFMLGTGVVYADDQDWMDFMLEGDYYCDNGEVMTFYDDYTAYYTGFDNCDVTWDWGESQWTAVIYFHFDNGGETVLYLDISGSDENGYTLSSDKDGFFMKQESFDSSENEYSEIGSDEIIGDNPYAYEESVEVTYICDYGFSDDVLLLDYYRFSNEKSGVMGVDKNGNQLFSLDGYKHYEGFDDGFAAIQNETGDTVCVIDHNGNILSSYGVDNLCRIGTEGGICAGYTFMRETVANFDTNKLVITIYDPYGSEVMKFDLDGEIQNPVPKYQGAGNIYFASSFFNIHSKKMTQIGRDDSYFLLTHEEKINYSPIGIIDSNQFAYVDSEGNYYSTSMPDYMQGTTYLGGGVGTVCGDFVMFEEQYGKGRVFFDVRNNKWSKYVGKYYKNLKTGPFFSGELSDTMTAIALVGADGEDYVGLLKLDDLSELCEPIHGSIKYLGNDFAFVIDGDKYKIYDNNGVLQYEIDSEDVLRIYSKNNALVFAYNTQMEIFSDGSMKTLQVLVSDDINY